MIKLGQSIVTIDFAVAATAVLNESSKHRYITLGKLQGFQVVPFSAQFILV